MIYVKRYFGCFVTDRRTDATMYCYAVMLHVNLSCNQLFENSTLLIDSQFNYELQLIQVLD